MSALAIVCMFCGNPMGNEVPVVVNLEMWGTEAEAIESAYWAHQDCLQAAVHVSIPLYILSLQGDEAVYGTRPSA